MQGYNDFLMNTSKDDLTPDNTGQFLPSEKTQTMFGGRSIGQISVGILRANQIIAGILQSPNGNTAFDLNNAQIYLSDGTYKRVLLDGGQTSGNPKFVISKPGFDATTATAEQSLIFIDNSGTKQRLQYTFTSGPVQRVNDFNLGGGFIARDTGAPTPVNYYAGLVFYIPSSWTVLNAQVQIISKDAGYSGGGPGYVLTRPVNLSVFLNPTETANGGGATPYYWTFSGGQTIASGVNPSSDNQTFNYTLNGTQLAAISTGAWNQLVVQQGTDDNTKFGNVAINITIDYILSIT